MVNGEKLRGKEPQPIPIPTFGVVLMHQGKILLVEHREGAKHITGKWGIPSGTQKIGETPKETAARECEEETGIKISPDMLHDYPNNTATADIPRKDGTKRFTVRAFLCTEFPVGAQIRETEEANAQWRSVEEAIQLDREGLMLPHNLSLIQSGINFQDSPLS